jgi:ribose transport system ATP-binding protein
MTAQTPQPLLSIEHLSKTFPGQVALRDVSLELRPGEVHALVGPNGSGKSTLIKLLASFHQPDPGAEVQWQGRRVDSLGDLDTRQLRFVHQDLGLVAELNAIDNFALVHGYAQRTRLGAIDWRRAAARAEELLTRLGVDDLDVWKPVGQYTPVERASVAIARALDGLQAGEGALVLDEPTASLAPVEVSRLFAIVRRLAAAGTSVLYVSHRLDEIFEIADRVTVLREGRRVATREVSELDQRELASLLVGHEIAELTRDARPLPSAGAEPSIAVQGLSSKLVREMSFEVGQGEIVGLAGLLGSGREEVPYAVAGALTPPAAGTFSVRGKVASKLDPRSAQGLGIAFVPADRGAEGSIADFNVAENITLPQLNRFTRSGLIDSRRERAEVQGWIERLDIRPPLGTKPFPLLSGGNQQKAVVAKALALEPALLVLAEPTAGVDIGARRLIYRLVHKAAAGGLGVLVSSSDVEDLISLCDRVIVLRDGREVRQLSGSELTQSSLLHAMEGSQQTTAGVDGGLL